MKLQELLDQVYEYSRNTDVLLDVGKSKAVDFTIEPVTEDGQVTGLILVEDKQMKLPFDEEPR